MVWATDEECLRAKEIYEELMLSGFGKPWPTFVEVAARLCEEGWITSRSNSGYRDSKTIRNMITKAESYKQTTPSRKAETRIMVTPVVDGPTWLFPDVGEGLEIAGASTSSRDVMIGSVSPDGVYVRPRRDAASGTIFYVVAPEPVDG